MEGGRTKGGKQSGKERTDVEQKEEADTWTKDRRKDTHKKKGSGIKSENTNTVSFYHLLFHTYPDLQTDQIKSQNFYLKVSIEVFFSFLQEVSVHIVEGFLSWKLEDRRQVLKLKNAFDQFCVKKMLLPHIQNTAVNSFFNHLFCYSHMEVVEVWVATVRLPAVLAAVRVASEHGDGVKCVGLTVIVANPCCSPEARKKRISYSVRENIPNKRSWKKEGRGDGRKRKQWAKTNKCMNTGCKGWERKTGERKNKEQNVWEGNKKGRKNKGGRRKKGKNKK